MASQGEHEDLQPILPSMKEKLDPTFERLYNENIANTPARAPDITVLRSNYSILCSYATGPAPAVGKVYDDTLPLEDGQLLQVRVYEPASEGPWPVHPDFHGGGWGLGDLDTESHICQHICAKANVAVIDVGYRLHPEHPFPAGIMDSFEALKYIHAFGAERFNIRTDSISLGGVSAGGFIALALSYLAAEASITLRLVTVWFSC